MKLMNTKAATLAVATVLLQLAAAPAVQAHEWKAKPRHGGIVSMANDTGFELVGQAGGVAIYLDDHGKPMAPTGYTGKLTVLKGSEKTEAPLAVAGDKLEAAGVKLAPGAKVVAALTTPQKKAITVRFTVK